MHSTGDGNEELYNMVCRECDTYYTTNIQAEALMLKTLWSPGVRVVKQFTSAMARKFKFSPGVHFTSPQLLHQLLDDGIYACGTVHLKCKGNPDENEKPSSKRQVRL